MRDRWSRLFVSLWLLGMIAHCDSRGYQGLELFVVIFAYWTLFSPGPRWLFFCVFAIQIASWWQQMPMADNHWLFAAVVNLILIGSFFYKEEEAYSAIRFCALCVYFIAVLHKLNSAFFDPSVSCAIVHGEKTLRQYGWLAANSTYLQSLGSWMIYSVLAMELLVPLLLMHRKAWPLGIALGVFFHVVTHMPNFGSLMFAIYFLFLPKEIGLKLSDRALKILVGVALALTIVNILGRNDLLSSFYLRLSVFFWMAGSLIVTGIFLYRLRRHWRPREYRLAPSLGIYWIVLVLFLLNGMSPYFGLKDSTSLAMWSNLNARKEGGNHFFVSTSKFKIFGYVDHEKTERPSWIERKLVSVNAIRDVVPEPCVW